MCTCKDGYSGHRCQYTDVCTSSAPCKSDEECVETIVRSEGYVCKRVEANSSVVVEKKKHGVPRPADLEEEVNTFMEVSSLPIQNG